MRRENGAFMVKYPPFIQCVQLCLLLWTGTLYAQCNLTQVPGISYQVGSCGNFEFQSLTGSLHSTYGQCGNLVFSPPLSGGDVITSTPKIEDGYSIRIFPNPTINECFLEILGYKNPMVTIKNIMGVSLMTAQPNTYLDLTDLFPGLYFVEISTAKGALIHTEKIIKL